MVQGLTRWGNNLLVSLAFDSSVAALKLFPSSETEVDESIISGLSVSCSSYSSVLVSFLRD